MRSFFHFAAFVYRSVHPAWVAFCNIPFCRTACFFFECVVLLPWTLCLKWKSDYKQIWSFLLHKIFLNFTAIVLLIVLSSAIITIILNCSETVPILPIHCIAALSSLCTSSSYRSALIQAFIASLKSCISSIAISLNFTSFLRSFLFEKQLSCSKSPSEYSYIALIAKSIRN